MPAIEDTQGDPRNYALPRTMYVAALRVSEACALCWRPAQPHRASAVLVVFGKGAKTRTVRIDATTYRRLLGVRPEVAGPDNPVFVSQRGGHLDPSAVWRVVQAAACAPACACEPPQTARSSEVSPHWGRHAHATHDRSRRSALAGAGHARPCQPCHHRHLRPRPPE